MHPPAVPPPPRSASLSPITALVAKPAPQPPLQQCLAVNAWSVVMVGVVTPLLIIYRQEERSRRIFAEQQRQQQDWLREQRGQRGQRGQRHLEWQAGEGARAAAARQVAAAGAEDPLLPLAGYWVLEFYIASSFVWSVASAVS